MKVFWIEFFTRPGCHLCAEAEPTVRRVVRWTGVRMREVNIDADPELAVDWGLRIPVVRAPDGSVLAEGQIRLLPLLRSVLAARLSL